MRRKFSVLIAFVLAATFILGALAMPGLAAAEFKDYGPVVDEIIMPIIKESTALRIAFERGETVVWPGLTQPADIDQAKSLDYADMRMTLGFHMFYLCFNMRKAPYDAPVIRQAMAHITDRDNIIRTLFKGYMLPMTSFVPQASAFYKEDLPTYPFNLARAAEILDEAGYVLDETGRNRIDPKTGKPLPEMKIFTPTYEVAPTSAELGKMIADSAQKVGLPVVPEPMDFNIMLDKIDIHDFDMYVLAWSLSRNPTHLVNFFHSNQDVEAGYNNPGIRDPKLDRVLDLLDTAPELQTARVAADEAQLILAREMPYIPLYSRPYIDAFRKDMVTGYIDMMGYGAASNSNQWTFLNVSRVDESGNPVPGGTIRWALEEEPKNLNPATASSAYEWNVLDRLFDGLYAMHPESLEDMTWMAKDWDVDTWTTDAGSEGTTITWYLHDGLKWSDGMPFTAEDIKFTIDFLKENKVPRYLPNTEDIAKVEVIDELTVKVYFDTVSYWHLYNAALSFLPKHIWDDVEDYNSFEPWLEPHPTMEGFTKLVGHGPFMLKEYRPGEFVRLVKNPNYWRLGPAN
ncbi:MAG: ABC transporter substrate-binding protein [Firmicutes bacterium]|nr:ABC transporter substrate-binding protein [Bacillota bacterium]